jgi:hypothetical protein
MKDTFIRGITYLMCPMPPIIRYTWRHMELILGIFGHISHTFQDGMCHPCSHDMSSHVTSSCHITLEDYILGYHIINESKKFRSVEVLKIKG